MALTTATDWDIAAADAMDLDREFDAGDNIELLQHQSQAGSSESTALAPHVASRPFCPQCRQSFSKKSALVHHQQTVCNRTNARCFNCPFCRKPFPRKDSCVRHIKETHGENSSGTSCPDCGNVFRPRVLQVHKCPQRTLQGRQRASQQNGSPGSLHPDTMLDIAGCVDPKLAAISLLRLVHFGSGLLAVNSDKRIMEYWVSIHAEAFEARRLSLSALRKALDRPAHSTARQLSKAILCQGYFDEYILDDRVSSENHFNALKELMRETRHSITLSEIVNTRLPFLQSIQSPEAVRQRIAALLGISRRSTDRHHSWLSRKFEDVEARDLKASEIREVLQDVFIFGFPLSTVPTLSTIGDLPKFARSIGKTIHWA